MIRILVLITLCLAPSALANLATCTSADVTASGWLPQTTCTTNDHLFAVVVRAVCHLHGSICAPVLLATTALLGQPPLAVSCPVLGGASLTIGRAAVTTHYANCTQCAPGYYQDINSQQEDECVSCPTGYYSAGAYASQFAGFIGITRAGNVTGSAGTTCSACGEGNFSNVSGLAQCYACEPGRYGIATGELECDLCGIGSSSVVPNCCCASLAGLT